jgi:hypothetical protein
MAFINAMNNLNITKKGVNGANVYTEEGVGDYRLVLFTMLNRGLENMEDTIEKIYKRNIQHELCDLFVMLFQTRDIKEGKGEKKLFYDFIKALYKYDKTRVCAMIRLIPHYGYWKDLWELIDNTICCPDFEIEAFKYIKEVYHDDNNKFLKNESISLLCKWLPREKSLKYPKLANKLTNFLFNHLPKRRRVAMYRKTNSKLNKYIKTSEINMCSSTWSEIIPKSVPGRSLKMHTKAFLNEPLKQLRYSDTLRYPNDDDRMKCRHHFLEFIEDIKNGKVKPNASGVVFPHELVSKSRENSNSTSEQEIYQGQWEAIRNETSKLGGLGKTIPMCDFSGSMNGIPKEISLALGILISEINHCDFRNHILTFSDVPTWFSFKEGHTLKQKLDSIPLDLSQGLNTDFYKACKCILDKMIEYRIKPGEEPEDLIVLTDMGFDHANLSDKSIQLKWESQLSIIRHKFHSAGEKIWGVNNGWKPPRIIIWNLRAAFNDFHAKAHQEGVLQLSGWSPSILKSLQTGIKVSTPYEGMRVVLDSIRYNDVRSVYNKF